MALWPKFASYAMSFVMLGVLWIGHHFQFQFIHRADRSLLWLNILFLLLITFLPFSTAVLGNYYDVPLAVALYGGTVVLAGTGLLAHRTYASRTSTAAWPSGETAHAGSGRHAQRASFITAQLSPVRQ